MLQNRLEFELRLQQYIELCRQRKVVDAREHGSKYFPPYMDSQKDKVLWASGLLAFPPDRLTSYSVRYFLSVYLYTSVNPSTGLVLSRSLG